MSPATEEWQYSRHSAGTIAPTNEWRRPCTVPESVELEKPVGWKRRAEGWCPRSTRRVTLHEPRPPGKETWEILPVALSHIGETIEDSRKILLLEDNWDDLGAVPIEEPTWRRAVEFLARHAKWVWENKRSAIESPEVLPGPDGSVDLHWDHTDYELLINVPAEPNSMAGFYGDDRGGISIKGQFDPGRMNKGLFDWLDSTT